MGNIGSISNAIYNLGWDFKLISETKDFEGISHLISQALDISTQCKN